MFMLCELHRVGSMTTLDNTKGSVGKIVEDHTTGNLYIKHGGVWQQITTNGAQGGNSAQAAATAVVANGQSLVLKNHSGTVSSGNAGLNSTGTVAAVAAGVVTAVVAGA